MDGTNIFARKYESDDGQKTEFQSLDEHLENVSRLCSIHAAAFGSGEWGRVIGLLHDIGKAKREFQAKLTENPALHVDHSAAGAVLLSQRSEPVKNLASLAIAGHHSGLPNKLRFDERLRKNESALLEIGRFNKMPDADLCLPEWLRRENISDASSRKRSVEFWIRFLFSALVDADRLDAESFDLRMKASGEMRVKTGREINISVTELQERLDSYIDEKMEAIPIEKKSSRVNAARAEVLRSCRDAAPLEPGFFSLTVPTGGGKTLSGMSFALNHARAHAMRRVICVIPYTSIIEQNAAVYREALGDKNVLEHHCNYDPGKNKKTSTSGTVGDDTLTLFEKAAENWDFLVIVTTTVQFFESLFANGATPCRKLHNIARSVIILDEAQSLPPKFIGTILDGLRELTAHYGCSVVISTATQPAWETRRDFVGIGGIRHIIPEPAKLFCNLSRVQYHWPQRGEKLSDWGELAEEILKRKKVLAITHKRKDARDLAREIRSRDLSSPLFHLSAQMCPAHRFQALGEINAVLKKSDLPCRVVSTQLVEAGVDLDFDVVYRAFGGLDSIVQAAGRCNREGRDELGHVYIYRFTEPPEGTLSHGRDTCEGMLEEARLDGKALDLEDPNIFNEYFRRFYFKKEPDPVPAERERLYYEEVDKKFKIINEDGLKSVVVPYGDAMNVVAEIRDIGWNKALRRKLQQFTVQINERYFGEIFHTLTELTDGSGVYVLESLYRESYDLMFGLLPPDEMKVCQADCLV